MSRAAPSTPVCQRRHIRRAGRSMEPHAANSAATSTRPGFWLAPTPSRISDTVGRVVHSSIAPARQLTSNMSGDGLSIHHTSGLNSSNDVQIGAGRASTSAQSAPSSIACSPTKPHSGETPSRSATLTAGAASSGYSQKWGRSCRPSRPTRSGWASVALANVRTEGPEFGFEGRNLVGRKGGTVSPRQRERDGHVFVPIADANRIGLPERHSEPGHEAESPSVPAHAEHDTGKIMAPWSRAICGSARPRSRSPRAVKARPSFSCTRFRSTRGCGRRNSRRCRPAGAASLPICAASGNRPVRANPARHVRDHAEDVIALVQELGAGPAVLVGLSMGGYIAFECWRRRPTAIRALVFADTRAEADADEARARRVALQDVARPRRDRRRRQRHAARAAWRHHPHDQPAPRGRGAPLGDRDRGRRRHRCAGSAAHPP